jgi:hypothetical protein
VSRVAVYTPAYLSRSKSESLVNILECVEEPYLAKEMRALKLGSPSRPTRMEAAVQRAQRAALGRSLYADVTDRLDVT